MTITVTCSVCHGPVDNSDTIPMPNGPACVDCYAWLESLLDDEDDELDFEFEEDDEEI